MPLFRDSFKNNAFFGFQKAHNINGLKAFKRSLEKHFFAKANVYNCSTDTSEYLLMVELECNLTLLELLFHYNKGDWGRDLCLEKLLGGVNSANQRPVDIDEFYLHLKDCSILINKIYEQSIVHQFRNILSTIGRHYVHFTKGLFEVPYEIFVPVFEEDNWETNSGFLNMAHGKNSQKDYFGYWGVYYTSEEEAFVYDLENRCLISGELSTFNQ